MASSQSSSSKPRLQPGQLLPPLRLHSLRGNIWDLRDQRGRFVLLVVYRGLHCDACRQHLRELASLNQQFAEQSVEVLVVSGDSRERAEQAAEAWQLHGLDVAYGLSIETILLWGLALSPGRGRSGSGLVEPPLFAEPGLFLIRSDGRLAAAALGSDSFSRPRLRELLRAMPLLLRQGQGVLPAG